MNKILIFLLLVLSTGVFGAEAPKIALVIGNEAYPSAHLKNPVNDAKAIAAKLRALGFRVELKTDANQKDMSRAINDFGEKVTLGSTALFYYAGHGIQVRGKNFLIPVDADIGSEAGVRGESIDLDQVLDQFGKANTSLVILDACRNNPFETRFRRAPAGLAQVDAPTGTLLAYATAPGKTAADGFGSNGLYTSSLLKVMDVPGLKIEDVFKQVRNEVIKASENQQTPWESSSLTADFYFKPEDKLQTTTAKLNEVEKSQQELLNEMRQVKMELLALQTRSAPVAVKPPAPVAPASATPKPAVAAAEPPKPATPAAESPKPAALVEASVPPKQQVALAAVAAKPPATKEIAGDWTERLAALDRARGKLSLSKGFAILLDAQNDESISVLVQYEAAIKRLRWHSAYAAGVNGNGDLVWGFGKGWRTAEFAGETAMERCTPRVASSCKVIVLNGEFREADFLGLARNLGKRDLKSVREATMAFMKKELAGYLAAR